MFFFVLLLPFLRFPIPPPGQQGILVTFGEEDRGGENSNQSEEIAETVKSTPGKAAEEQKNPPKSNTKADIKSSTIADESSPVIADEKAKNENKKPEKTAERYPKGDRGHRSCQKNRKKKPGKKRNMKRQRRNLAIYLERALEINLDNRANQMVIQIQVNWKVYLRVLVEWEVD